MGQGSRAGMKPSVGMWRCKIRSGEMGNQECGDVKRCKIRGVEMGNQQWGDVKSGVWGCKIRSVRM